MPMHSRAVRWPARFAAAADFAIPRTSSSAGHMYTHVGGWQITRVPVTLRIDSHSPNKCLTAFVGQHEMHRGMAPSVSSFSRHSFLPRMYFSSLPPSTEFVNH